MSIRQKTISGLIWSAIEKIGYQGLNFIIFLLLARLLDPQFFGLIAMANVFLNLINSLQNVGMGQALIQKESIEPDHFNTAFWLNIMISIVLCISIVIFSGVIASFYKTPELQKVLIFLSFMLPLSALSFTQEAVIKRKMDFKNLAARTLISRSIGGFFGIGAALIGFGVWSLVIQSLIGNFVKVIVLWRVSDWRPNFRFSYPCFLDLFKYGRNILGINLLNVITQRLDDLLIGYFLGPVMLGYYSIAYRLLITITSILQSVLGQVLFPAFSRLKKQKKRLRNALSETIELTAFYSFPVFLTIIVLANEIIVVLFGEKWIPSVMATQVLMIGGITKTILMPMNNLP